MNGFQKYHIYNSQEESISKIDLKTIIMKNQYEKPIL